MKIRLMLGLGVIILFLAWVLYMPVSWGYGDRVAYTVQKGLGQRDVAKELEQKGIIKNRFLFEVYSFITGNYDQLKAGVYDISPSMSMVTILERLVKGEVLKNKMVILEGWDTADIAKYLESKNFYSKDDILNGTKNITNKNYDFLKSNPKTATLEGYLFPDTYLVPMDFTAEEFLKMVLNNFDKKLTPELRKAIADQKKTMHEVVTMASILEKEVRSLDDKKVVAGILWKRIGAGMPLQVDSTINYITGKSDPRATIKDLKIDSKYNTYKYVGLPAGPISNPGLDSIVAAIYPVKSQYWYYLSAKKTGATVYSKTFYDHSVAIARYLR